MDCSKNLLRVISVLFVVVITWMVLELFLPILLLAGSLYAGYIVAGRLGWR